MKELIFILTFLTGCAFHAIGSEYNKTDTNAIPSSKTIPEVIIKNQTIREIKDLVPIQTNASLYIKNYGEGQLSTLQFRGFNATHNDVEWLGIPLYSPYNASVDLSIIPFQMVENGASFRNLGTSFSIAEEEKPQGQPQTLHQFQTLGRLYNFYQAKYHFTHQQAIDKVSLDVDIKKGENNYLFERNGKRENLVHNEFDQYSLYGHYATYNASKSILHGFYGWFNATDRNIPPTLNQYSSAQRYAEQSFRTAYTINSARIQNTLFTEINQSQYNDDAAFISSIYHSQSIRNKFNFNHAFSLFNFQYTLLTSLDILQTSVFTENKNLFNQHHQIKFSKVWNEHQIMIACMMVGQQNKLSIPQPTIRYTLEKKYAHQHVKSELTFKMKTRFPSANDLYWPGVGNNKLLPEQSYQGIHQLVFQLNSSNLNTQLSATEFIYYTEQLINWIPTASGQWAPHNLTQVLSYGFQPQFSIDWRHKIAFTTQYQFNPALNLDKSNPGIYLKQILYAPVHKWSNELTCRFSSVVIQTSTIYTSERYFTTDNSLSLDPYFLVNIKFAYTHKKMEWGLRLDNLMNENYQEIAERPMPGILPAITLKYTTR